MEFLIPSDFTRKYGGGLPNPVILKPPDGSEWKIYWEKHDGDIWFEKGWEEFATYYSLDHCYFMSFKYDGTCDLQVIIFNVAALEIEYPSHVIDDENDNIEKFIDDSVEFLGEGPSYPNARPILPFSHSLKKLRNGKLRDPERSPILKKCQTHNAGKKSTLSPLRPCKKMRACTNDEAKSTSNLQKKPINGELIQMEGRSNFTTRKCSNALAIRRSKPLTDVEKARALQRVSAFNSKYPHFKYVMQPSYVSKTSLRIPPELFIQHLKKKQGAMLLQALDGRTWASSYKVDSFGKNAYISGWRAFVKDNFLEVGDVCVFELTQRTKATLRVTISRPAKQPSCLVNSVSAQRGKCKARRKSPLPPLRSKEMRACTNGEGESTSNLQKMPGNGQIIQVEGRRKFSTRKCSNSLAIGRSKPLTEVEKVRALHRVSTSGSEYPHFKRFMRPSHVSKHYLTIPPQFCKQHLKRKHGAVLLQTLDGRTWSAKYKVGFNNKANLSGWKAFAKDNYVQVGDVCVFELTQITKATLRVTISRPAKQPSCLVNSGRQATALEEAGKLSLENPVFKVTLKKNHLFSAMGVPVEFLRSYIIKREKNVLIQQGNHSWPAKLIYYPEKHWGYLSKSWLSFARESKLQVGDVCVFELIKRDDPVLKVYVYRCRS